jgi:hypothetical protein
VRSKRDPLRSKQTLRTLLSSANGIWLRKEEEDEEEEECVVCILLLIDLRRELHAYLRYACILLLIDFRRGNCLLF